MAHPNNKKRRNDLRLVAPYFDDVLRGGGKAFTLALIAWNSGVSRRRLGPTSGSPAICFLVAATRDSSAGCVEKNDSTRVGCVFRVSNSF